MRSIKEKLNLLKISIAEREKLGDEIRDAGRPPHGDFWIQSIWCADKKIKDSYDDLKSDFIC